MVNDLSVEKGACYVTTTTSTEGSREKILVYVLEGWQSRLAATLW